MSNTKPTLYLDELVFKNECNVDFLFREEQFCLQVSAPDGRIIQREFVALIFKKRFKKRIKKGGEKKMENREKVKHWINEGLLAKPLNGIDVLYENISLTKQRLADIFGAGFGYVTEAQKVLWFHLPQGKCIEATMNGDVLKEWDISSFPGQDVWGKIDAIRAAHGVKVSV